VEAGWQAGGGLLVGLDFWFGPGKTGSSYLGMEALTEGEGG
jgi:hypothetical protein